VLGIALGAVGFHCDGGGVSTVNGFSYANLQLGRSTFGKT
jgi:hypothetical protein